MRMEPVLVDGEWRLASSPLDTFTATNPATGAPLPEVFPVSGADDVERVCAAGREAAMALRACSPDDIASFLEDFAARIETRADELVAIAHRETALPVTPRLRAVELPRTTGQLRQAAAAARERSWCRPTIDSAANIRSMLAPLGGPVVVIGPSNFPFAFNGVSGGDFAAAIAAGNPVIAKAHPGHPGTTRTLAEAALDAVRATGLPPATVQMLYHLPAEYGFKLVSDPAVAATAFTGSRAAGLRLKQAADAAGKPIYLEMSGTNPVVVMPGALAERHEEIARELFDSCALGAGQFCTRPALTIVRRGDDAERFVGDATACFAHEPPGTLLSASGRTTVSAIVGALVEHGATLLAGGHPVAEPRFAFENTLLRVPGDVFLAHAGALQAEAFGPVNLIVVALDAEEMLHVTRALEGSLTGTIYSAQSGADDPEYDQLAPVLRQKTGRLLNDKMPTGVAVSPAMSHGGPYPSTGHPGFTAVGIPASLVRFAALHCYDAVRLHRLPAELANSNPTGTTWRLIDGAWTQKDVDA